MNRSRNITMLQPIFRKSFPLAWASCDIKTDTVMRNDINGVLYLQNPDSN